MYGRQALSFQTPSNHAIAIAHIANNESILRHTFQPSGSTILLPTTIAMPAHTTASARVDEGLTAVTLLAIGTGAGGGGGRSN